MALNTRPHSFTDLPDSNTFYPAKLVLLLIFSYILLTPSFDLMPDVGMYNEKRILECLIFLIAAMTLLFDKHLRYKWIDVFTALPLAIRYMLFSILVIGLISATNAQQITAALLDVALYSLIFIMIIMLAAIHSLVGLKWFASLFMITLLASISLYLTTFVSGQIAASLEPVPLLQQSLFANFAHLRFFSQFQSWTLPLVILPLLLVPRLSRSLKILTLIIAAGWWYLLFTSGTRGTILGLIIAFAAVAIVFGRHALPWLKWQGIAVAAGLLMYLTFFFILPTISNNDASSVVENTVDRKLMHSTGRFRLWEKAGQMIADKPLLGVGPMHYGCDLDNKTAAHPHNSILQIAAEWGLPVAFLLLALILFGLFRWILCGRNLLLKPPTQLVTGLDEAQLYPALLASSITAAIHSLFSGIIIMPLSQMIMIIIIGWMIAVYHRNGEKHLIKKHSHFALIALLLISSGTLVYTTTPDIFNLFEMQQTFLSEHPTSRVLPRFWQQGRICG